MFKIPISETKRSLEFRDLNFGFLPAGRFFGFRYSNFVFLEDKGA
jgi:hypothetical protein